MRWQGRKVRYGETRDRVGGGGGVPEPSRPSAARGGGSSQKNPDLVRGVRFDSAARSPHWAWTLTAPRLDCCCQPLCLVAGTLLSNRLEMRPTAWVATVAGLQPAPRSPAMCIRPQHPPSPRSGLGSLYPSEPRAVAAVPSTTASAASVVAGGVPARGGSVTVASTPCDAVAARLPWSPVDDSPHQWTRAEPRRGGQGEALALWPPLLLFWHAESTPRAGEPRRR